MIEHLSGFSKPAGSNASRRKYDASSCSRYISLSIVECTPAFSKSSSYPLRCLDQHSQRLVLTSLADLRSSCSQRSNLEIAAIIADATSTRASASKPKPSSQSSRRELVDAVKGRDVRGMCRVTTAYGGMSQVCRLGKPRCGWHQQPRPSDIQRQRIPAEETLPCRT